jgi:superfamily II DNA or RNA helicase
VPLFLETPVKLRLPQEWVGSSVEDDLREQLGYEDGGITHEWRTWASIQRADNYKPNSHWFTKKNGRELLDAKVAELEAAKHKTALFKDKSGALYTYSGLATRLSKRYQEPVIREYPMPEFRAIPYEGKPFESRWYQQKAEDLLVPLGHGSVELATGLGKSLLICKLCKHVGLPTVIVAPTLSIATQLLADMTRLFGKKRVGQFFGGKKEPEKYFVVAVSKSLTGLLPEDRSSSLLAKKSMVIGDESHLLPADTLAKVMLKLFSQVPYRFFVSGTQMRGDGLDIVLEGITGDVVIRMSVREGVEEGFLSRPIFYQCKVRSNLNLDVPDSIKMNRTHLHQNEEVYKHAGAMASRAAQSGHRPLILVEEVSQFSYLLPYLTVEAGFAHGGVDKDGKKKLPEAYHKSEPMKLVERFDKKELPILVGTQCIGTGTDIKTADMIIDIVGLASEVRIRQNVGRGTRISEGKTKFTYFDYDVVNIPKMTKHAEKRRKIFDDIYGPVRRM